MVYHSDKRRPGCGLLLATPLPSLVGIITFFFYVVYRWKIGCDISLDASILFAMAEWGACMSHATCLLPQKINWPFSFHILSHSVWLAFLFVPSPHQVVNQRCIFFPLKATCHFHFTSSCKPSLWFLPWFSLCPLYAPGTKTKGVFASTQTQLVISVSQLTHLSP
jgi:hypothetical protein